MTDAGTGFDRVFYTRVTFGTRLNCSFKCTHIHTRHQFKCQDFCYVSRRLFVQLSQSHPKTILNEKYFGLLDDNTTNIHANRIREKKIR